MTRNWTMIMAMVLAVGMMLLAPEAQAAGAPPAGGGGGSVCMKDIMSGGGGGADGIVTQAIEYIEQVIMSAAQDLYVGIATNTDFQAAVGAAFALFIAVFGAAFMFGIVPFNYGQALVRLLKMGIIMACIGGAGWSFFNEYAVAFFQDGVDALISDIVEVATGESVTAGGEPKPFKSLEEVAQKAISPQMMTSIIASFGTGAMGPVMGTLSGAGLLAFIMMIVTALRVYCVSMVARAFLLGLGPIFLCFMLFQKTQHIFDGWINQLVNYSLQPILMFAFISFYIVLLQSAVENILAVDTCWVEYDDQSGADPMTMQWRFVNEKGEATKSDFSWDGLVECLAGSGGGGGNCKSFPVSIIDILTFLILAHLGYRFSNVVTLIATEIASSTLNLKDLRSGMQEYFQNAQTGSTAGQGRANAPK